MNPDISPTMADAIAFAQANGGKLTRFPGGFWTRSPWTGGSSLFGTSTIDALVRRGFASYSAWRESANGYRFPIEITLSR